MGEKMLVIRSYPFGTATHWMEPVPGERLYIELQPGQTVEEIAKELEVAPEEIKPLE